jgi:two-component system C4-dicarboxylate transport response regulator DctD
MKLKMMVIDDDAITLTMLKSYLDGYEELDVRYVDNPSQALRLIEAEKFNIVMSDIVMPGMDGITLVRTIRNTDPLIHLIIMTSHSSLSFVIQALEAGALDFVIKPFSGQEEIDLVVGSSIRRWERWKTVLQNVSGK